MYVIQHGISQEVDMDVFKKVATGNRNQSQKFFGSSHERLQEVLEMERRQSDWKKEHSKESRSLRMISLVSCESVGSCRLRR